MMSAPTPPSKDSLTFLVFKNGLTARTFQVSMGWISKLGLTLGALALISVGALLLSARTYLALQQAKKNGNPTRLLELETELSQLKATHQNLLAKSTDSPGAPTERSDGNAVNSTPATPVSTAPASSALFSGLPAGSTAVTPDRATLPFKLTQPKASWRGGILRVGFAIQYTRDDGGNQQGHIIVLARGPETMLAYPDGVLNPMSSDILIKADAGEYFSVSRFREVSAEFGPIPTRDQITEVQVLLVDQNKKLLLMERIIPEKPAARKRSDAPPVEEENDHAPPTRKDIPTHSATDVPTPGNAGTQ